MLIEYMNFKNKNFKNFAKCTDTSVRRNWSAFGLDVKSSSLGTRNFHPKLISDHVLKEEGIRLLCGSLPLSDGHPQGP